MSIFLSSCLSHLAAFLNFIPIPNPCKTVLSYIIKCEKPWQKTQTPNVTTQSMQSSDAALWYYLCYQNKHRDALQIGLFPLKAHKHIQDTEIQNSTS